MASGFSTLSTEFSTPGWGKGGSTPCINHAAARGAGWGARGKICTFVAAVGGDKRGRFVVYCICISGPCCGLEKFGQTSRGMRRGPKAAPEENEWHKNTNPNPKKSTINRPNATPVSSGAKTR